MKEIKEYILRNGSMVEYDPEAHAEEKRYTLTSDIEHLTKANWGAWCALSYTASELWHHMHMDDASMITIPTAKVTGVVEAMDMLDCEQTGELHNEFDWACEAVIGLGDRCDNFAKLLKTDIRMRGPVFEHKAVDAVEDYEAYKKSDYTTK